MRRKKCLQIIGGSLAIIAVIFILGGSAGAQVTFTTLHSFSGADGQEPMGHLIPDAAGNLYSVTRYGGVAGWGTVFELTPNADGTWTESVLYSFTGGADGGEPLWSSPVFDSAGNLYGVTAMGGASGYGVVFELTPNLDGTWTESVLYSFSGGQDGGVPMGSPVLDSAGNLYGTTTSGGGRGNGVVFELTPNPDGSWTESVLHQFTGGNDGGSPWASLVFDKAGYLYGTTRGGGLSTCECGTVFQLTPGSEGTWTFRVIHRFSGGEGGFDPSIATLVFDTAGNLYGTTEFGGTGNCDYVGIPGCGTAFEIVAGSGSYRVIYDFKGGKAGANPFGVVFGAAGTLYGTTVEGGLAGCDGECGTVFTSTHGGQILHRFTGGNDGGNPNPGLIFDNSGNLYGTARLGGASGDGVVFEITP